MMQRRDIETRDAVAIATAPEGRLRRALRVRRRTSSASATARGRLLTDRSRSQQPILRACASRGAGSRAQPIERNQRRAIAAGQARLGAAVGPAPPRVRESARPVRRRDAPARSTLRRSVPVGAYRHRYHSPSAVSRLRSHAWQNGSVVDEMMPNTVPSGRRKRSAGADDDSHERLDRARSAPRAARASPAATRRGPSTSAWRRRRPCTR